MGQGGSGMLLQQSAGLSREQPGAPHRGAAGGKGLAVTGLSHRQGGLSAAPSRAVSAVKNINLPEIPRNINIGDINIKVPNLSQFM